MIVRTSLTPEQIRECADSVGVRIFADYAQRGVERQGGVRGRPEASRYNFRLALGERRLPGGNEKRGWLKYQRTSASYFNRGRKVAAVCWHGYRDFMLTVFERDPEARITTVCEDYRGREDFLDKYPDTAYRNIGPPIDPVYMHHACTCHENGNPWIVDLSTSPQTQEVHIAYHQIQGCPHLIMVPDHYRPDGTCKCDDPTEQDKMVREWGYSKEDFAHA